MSLKRNIFASYVSQIYIALIGILIVPVYIRYMGTEAYGLVGFYAMLQAWFQLLDMGLAPTMARETARFKGGAINEVSLLRLLRALEVVFYSVGVVGALVLFLCSDVIASSWLKVEQLPIGQVKTAIELMAGIIGLRWIAGLYRGAIGGFEQQIWLSKLNVGIATARFVAVILIFEAIGVTPLHFFSYQLLVAFVETGWLIVKTYKLMPPLPPGARTPWSLAPLHSVIKFSLSVAFTSSVWVLVTQTDKLILSKLLPLSIYAYFTLAVLVAGGVSIMSGPVSSVLLPRLSRLNAEHDEAGFFRLYRQATQLVAVIVAPIALMLAFFAEPILLVWTGNLETARAAAPILQLYAIGNGVLAFGAFPYYLQFAKGDLRLHMVGNLFFLVLLIPSVVAGTYRYGAVGAGWAWLVANIAYFLLWVPFVHHRLSPGLHRSWLISDVLPIFLSSAAIVFLASVLISASLVRGAVIVYLLFWGVIALLGATFSSVHARSYILSRFKLAK